VTGLPTASDLWLLEPLGERTPEPRVLMRAAQVDRVRSVGVGHLKLTLRVGTQQLSAFGYEMAPRAPTPGQRIDAVGNLRPDHWAGAEKVELRLLDFDAAE
jgi:single-stranded DNA-specific DHH superfamily exonuclease